MQVNVFVSEVKQDCDPTQMLVSPFGPEAVIPCHLRHFNWRYFATAEADDRIIGLPLGVVEVALAAGGYVLTAPKVTRLTLCR